MRHSENEQAVYLRLCNPIRPMYRKQERYIAYFWHFWDMGAWRRGVCGYLRRDIAAAYPASAAFYATGAALRTLVRHAKGHPSAALPLVSSVRQEPVLFGFVSCRAPAWMGSLWESAGCVVVFQVSATLGGCP